MKNSKYHYYNSLFKNQSLPLAYCDLDLLDKNIKDIANRTANAHKTIRIASKSVRSTSILKRILDSHSIYKGLMCFSGSEAIFLSESGFDDLLLGYPIVNADEITKICEATKFRISAEGTVAKLLNILPNPTKLSEEEQFTLAQIIDGVDRIIPGTLDRLQWEWRHAA